MKDGPAARPVATPSTPADSGTLRTWLVRGGTIGLAAGLVELVSVAWPALKPQAPWPGMFHLSPHWLWLKPLAVATLGAIIGASGGLLARLAPRLARPRGILWSVTAACLLAALFPCWPRIKGASLVLLAAGAAVPLSQWLVRHERLLRSRTVRLTSAIVVALLASVGGALVAAPVLRERQAAAALPPAPAGAPNIVFVVLDTVRLDAVDSLPNLRRLAERGVKFSQAYATSSWTLETHATLFTGQYPQHVFTRGETPLNFESPLPRELPTIAEVFRDHGYLTGGFVANTIYTSREHGLDRGFSHYDDYPLTAEDLIASSTLGNKVLKEFEEFLKRPRVIGRRNAEQVTQAFLEWFDRRADRPVFGFLNYFDAHDPYLPPGKFRSPEAPANAHINPLKRYGPEETAALRVAYDDCVKYVDHVVGLLVQALEARGVLDTTVLLVTSDHGEHFGEHELMTHGNSLYRATLEVPLVIRYPKAIPAGLTVPDPVSLRDVPATLLDLGGIPAAALPGTSLAPRWGAGAPGGQSPVVSTLIIGRERHRWAPAFWPISRGSVRSIVLDGLHYIRSGDGAEELYELATDVNETRDLSRVPKRASDLKRLRTALDDVEHRREPR